MATNQNISNSGSDDAESFTLKKISALIESKEEFPIDFDDAWQWIGYSTKGNAKGSFEGSGFVAGMDFRVFMEKNKNSKGGRPTEKIYLTLDCFKSFCMMAGTIKGQEVRRYFLECEKELHRLKATPQPDHKLSWFFDRIQVFRKKTKIPVGYFCIFEEIIFFVAEIEESGYKLPQSVIPDISVGKCWCNQLRKDGFDMSQIDSYPHFYPGRSFAVDANIYPIEWLPKFRVWFEDTYKPLKSVAYFQKSHPQALPSLCKVLGLPEAQ